jgi:hypothetical protein
MLVNELRLGNWVKINDDHFNKFKDIRFEFYKTNRFKILGWNDGSAIDGCKQIAFYKIPSILGGSVHSGIPDNLIKPLELTEKWAIKLGFKKIVFETSINTLEIVYYKKENFVIYILDDSFEVELIKKDGSQFNLFTNFKKEVHKLQNVYFELTGKELV